MNLTFRQYVNFNGKWVFNTEASQVELGYSTKRMKKIFRQLVENHKSQGYIVENLSVFHKRIYVLHKDGELSLKMTLC